MMPTDTESGPPESGCDWMKLALEEARKGSGATCPNPPVGAVLVKDGMFLAKGHHRKLGGPHAEIEAIRAVRDPELIRGATLYVTLEPCSTRGRTGACTDSILKEGIGKVVVGAVDPNPEHEGRGLDLLQKQGVELESGVLKAECEWLIRGFSKRMLTGRPWVIAKTGMTLDGRITPPEGGSRWITSEAAREDVQRLRSEVDAVLVGGTTLRKDDPRLTLRGKWAELPRPQPLRVVVTQTGDLPKEAALFTDEYKDRTRVFHVEHLETALDELGKEGVCTVLLECGGQLMAHAFEDQLVDEVTFYMAPLIGGGSRRAVEGENFRCRLLNPQVARIGPDLRVNARVSYE